MKTINVLLMLLMLAFTFACGGGESQQQETTEMAEPSEMEESQQAETKDIRTIEIIGIDEMKFTVESEMEGITVGGQAGTEGNLLLLETIEVQPGEQIRIRLTTRSQLPPTAMSHNWVLLVADADATAYVNKASQAKDQDYMPEELSDQVLFHTEMVGGGETTEVVVTAPEEPGDYEYLCSFPGHYVAGMKGILAVQGQSEMGTE